MSFITEIPLIGTTLGYVVPFLLLLGVVVFVHEYGHYIVGRWCGIGAKTFSVGFGKRLFGWTDKRGTHWQVALLPLGGFVKFVGNMDPAGARDSDEDLTLEERKVAFHNASITARALTVVAGPVANFLLSIVIFAGVALAVGKASDQPLIGSVDEEMRSEIPLQAGDRVLQINGNDVPSWSGMVDQLMDANGAATTLLIERDGVEQNVVISQRLATRIGAVRPRSPAQEAGLQAGDAITAVNGIEVRTFRELQILTAEIPLETEIEVSILRDGEPMVFTLLPTVMVRQHPVTKERVPQPTMGITSERFAGLRATMVSQGLLEAAEFGVTETWRIISLTMGFLGDLIFGKADTSQLGGPIGIAQASASQAKAGLTDFVYLIAILSTSIGLLNLFPIPILDGGHLMFYAAEALRGKPLGEKVMNTAMMIGLCLVLLLMGFATYNDLMRL